MNKGETAGETIGSGSEQDGTGSVTSRRQSMAAQYFAKLDAMRRVVAKYSPDGDDLHPDGVAQMALELGITLDGTQLADALTEMDGDGDGSISPMEFEAWIKRQIMHTKHVASQRTKPEARSQADDEDDEISSDLRPAGEAGSVKSGVSIFGYGTNAAAWAAFRRLDVDASGTLDFEEFSALSQELRLQLSKKEMTEGWRTQLDPLETGAVCFEDFVVFFNRIKARERRKVLRKISTYFQRADINGDGLLDKEEFAKVLEKSKLVLDPPFDLEADWEKLNKTRKGEFPDFIYEITYADFTSWFKQRLNIEDDDIPVLPEYLVAKIEESGTFNFGGLNLFVLSKTVILPRDSRESRGTDFHTCGAATFNPSDGSKHKGHHGIDLKKIGRQRNAKQLWASLRPRLRALVQLQRQWGKVHDMYHVDVHHETADLSRWIRDPDSNFSQAWDIAQVLLLFYISIVVPVRAGFEVDVAAWSTTFWFDMAIDVYFLLDIILNFRTAFYTKNGLREDRPNFIARNYLKGWFAIDFASTLPLSYIAYFTDDSSSSSDLAGSLAGEEATAGGGGTRALKALRLVRLSKMLRIARIKRILRKYSDNVHMGTIISVGFTVFIIFFLVHMLACFFYLIGTGEEEFPVTDDTIMIKGWVHQEDLWEPVVEGKPRVPGIGKRYLTSMFYVLNALEHALTNHEMLFALFAELMRDFILGLVAGLMATISMAAGDNDQEQLFKLRDMKVWMSDREVPKSFRDSVLSYFNELWNNRTEIDTAELFTDMPPTMRRTLTNFLYSKHVSNIPMFRNLSNAVISAICAAVHPLYVLRGQEVITEGTPGVEFYMLMSGELEVFRGVGDEPRVRLGFLTPGAFFGEAAIFAGGAEVRTRTVVAVTDSDLCFLTREEIQDLTGQYPELEARLNRFTTIGKKRLLNKNAKRSEQTLTKVYAAKFTEMVDKVRAHNREQQAEYVLADDTVHVGQVTSWKPPHPDAMTEEGLAERFREYGEVITAVIRYRPATVEKPNNSWALVVFNGPGGVRKLLQGQNDTEIVAKQRNGDGKMNPSVNDLNKGWRHRVRRIDPKQAMESSGAFGAVFQICRQRVIGVAQLEARNLTPYLREAAEALRQQTLEHHHDRLSDSDDEDQHVETAATVKFAPGVGTSIAAAAVDKPSRGRSQTTAQKSEMTKHTETLRQSLEMSLDLVPPTCSTDDMPAEPEPEPAGGSFWSFVGGDTAPAVPSPGSTGGRSEIKSLDVYGPALAQMMETIAEMQRVQREANNRLQAQGVEQQKTNRVLDRMEKHLAPR